MSALRIALAGVVGAGALGLLACGAAATAPPAAPAKGEAPSGRDVEQQKSSDELQEPEQPGAKPVEPTPSVAIKEVDEAESDLARGETDLASALSAGNDCKLICKAFESMQRAANRICELNGPDDPAARCAKARAQRDEARERVRRACGGCG